MSFYIPRICGLCLKVSRDKTYYLVFVETVISEEMINDGYETITNIDISQVVIDAMKEKYKNMPQLRCNFDFI